MRNLRAARANLEEKAAALDGHGKSGSAISNSAGKQANSRGPGSGRLPPRALHGAQLTIYNDQPVDSTYYVDGSLKSDRKPGNGLVVASGPNPGQ